ncbi:hypothetical protein Tco_1261304 [Tanacetum coccineum]
MILNSRLIGKRLGKVLDFTLVKSEDYQEYGFPIPDVMLTDAIKRLKSYQMFIKYSINQIPHKKIRGNGSKGKKTADESQETIDVKTVDHSSEVLAILQSQVPTVVDSYLDTKVEDIFQKELQKHTTYLIHKYSLQHLPELTKKPTLTAEQ